MPYFCVILTQKQRISVAPPGLRRVAFKGTQMGRELLVLEAELRDNADGANMRLYLSTSHLESQADHAAARQAQMNLSMEALVQAGQSGRFDMALFGGDLNMRDKEQAVTWKKLGLDASKKAPVARDAWEAAGSASASKFTWDLRLNDNVTMPGGMQPRCRFDRLFFLESMAERQSTGAGGRCTNAIRKFALVGTKRLDHGRFVSDHFGVLTEFHCSRFPTGGRSSGDASGPPRRE